MKKYLFLDRDGTLILEPHDFQVDSLEKLNFYPKIVSSLLKIKNQTDFHFVMVTNQDGLGTPDFPYESFEPPHRKLLQLLGDEGIFFEEILIDASYEHENAPTRKPRTGLLTHFFDRKDIDWQNSFVIGDRLTDIELAFHLGIKAVFVGKQPENNYFPDTLAFSETDWGKIAEFLVESGRGGKASLARNTKETQITCALNLFGSGILRGGTGFQFFDHLLMQFVFHSKINLTVECVADAHIDEHHGIEDFAIVFGECFRKALGSKKGIARYGFFNLVMDETLAQVALDFSSRPFLTWDVPFSREKIGDTATEMLEHFFRSFCTHAGISAHVKTQGRNEHHLAEATFKAFAKSVFAALLPLGNDIQSTKGLV